MIPGLKFNMIFGNVFTLFGTIRFAAVIDLEIYIWCPVIWGFLAGIMVLTPPIFANIYDRSELILKRGKKSMITVSLYGHEKSISSTFEAKLLERSYRACRPIQCQVGPFYTFKRGTGLICFSIIIDMTLYFLLTQ
jgi:hypothetical protein